MLFRSKNSVQMNGYAQEEILANKRRLLKEKLDSQSEQNQKAEAVNQGDGTEETQESEEKKQESKTDTDIIVKADGSRVLLMTTRVCGMQTTRSVELSKPTAMQNDISEQESKPTAMQNDISEQENSIGTKGGN